MTPRENRGAALSDYVQMVWERRWLIAAIVVLASGLAFATRPPKPVALYRATVTIEVRPFTFSSEGQSAVQVLTSVPPSEVQQARSPEVAATTAGELGLTDGGVDLLSRLIVTPQPGTDLIQLELTGSGIATRNQLKIYADNYVDFRKAQDADRLARVQAQVNARIAEIQPRFLKLSQQVLAERRANKGSASPQTQTQFDTVAGIYNGLVSLEERIKLDADLAGNTVQVIGTPIAQHLSAIPTRTLRMLAGPVVGLLLGAALAIALAMLRPRISGREAAEEQLGQPVLAVIPLMSESGVAKDPLIVQRDSPWGLEGIRMLLTEIDLFENGRSRVGVLVVASPQAHDGRSTLAANLAASYAASGRSVALLRADGRPGHGSGYGPRSTGFLEGDQDIVQVRMHKHGFAEVIPGPVKSDAASGISTGMPGIVQKLAGDFDVVVVDTRPLLASADALMVSRQADAVIMVLRQFKTSQTKAALALDMLTRHDAPIVGLALNGFRIAFIERYREGRTRNAPPETGKKALREPQRKPAAVPASKPDAKTEIPAPQRPVSRPPAVTSSERFTPRRESQPAPAPVASGSGGPRPEPAAPSPAGPAQPAAPLPAGPAQPVEASPVRTAQPPAPPRPSQTESLFQRRETPPVAAPGNGTTQPAERPPGSGTTKPAERPPGNGTTQPAERPDPRPIAAENP